jgi:hypothetical protein
VKYVDISFSGGLTSAGRREYSYNRFFNEVVMAKSDVFVETSKSRFEGADASEVSLGVGGTFRAEQIGTLGVDSGGSN